MILIFQVTVWYFQGAVLHNYQYWLHYTLYLHQIPMMSELVKFIKMICNNCDIGNIIHLHVAQQQSSFHIKSA